MTAATTTPAPLLVGLADLLARAHRPLQRPLLAGITPEARDRHRLLVELRALPDTDANAPYGVRVEGR